MLVIREPDIYVECTTKNTQNKGVLSTRIREPAILFMVLQKTY